MVYCSRCEYGFLTVFGMTNIRKSTNLIGFLLAVTFFWCKIYKTQIPEVQCPPEQDYC